MSRDGYLPPGVEYCDLPGNDSDHHQGCAGHEDNDPPDDVECSCAELAQEDRDAATEARKDAAEAKFEESRENQS